MNGQHEVVGNGGPHIQVKIKHAIITFLTHAGMDSRTFKMSVSVILSDSSSKMTMPHSQPFNDK